MMILILLGLPSFMKGRSQTLLERMELELSPLDVCCHMINDNLGLHEVEESIDVWAGRNCGDHWSITPQRWLEIVFKYLVKVVVLEVIDDANVVDVFTVFTQESVSTLSTGLLILELLADVFLNPDSRLFSGVFFVLFDSLMSLINFILVLANSFTPSLEELLFILKSHLMHELVNNLLPHILSFCLELALLLLHDNFPSLLNRSHKLLLFGVPFELFGIHLDILLIVFDRQQKRVIHQVELTE